MVGIGESISDTLEIEYVTAGILLPRTYERITGSMSVRWVHTKRTPPDEAGGLPLTMTPPPKAAVA